MAIESIAIRKKYESPDMFLEDTQTLWISNILLHFMPFDNHKGEKGALKQVMFYFE